MFINLHKDQKNLPLQNMNSQYHLLSPLDISLSIAHWWCGIFWTQNSAFLSSYTELLVWMKTGMHIYSWALSLRQTAFLRLLETQNYALLSYTKLLAWMKSCVQIYSWPYERNKLKLGNLPVHNSWVMILTDLEGTQLRSYIALKMVYHKMGLKWCLCHYRPNRCY